MKYCLKDVWPHHHRQYQGDKVMCLKQANEKREKNQKQDTPLGFINLFMFT
jgi:hypothetical protein